MPAGDWKGLQVEVGCNRLLQANKVCRIETMHKIARSSCHLKTVKTESSGGGGVYMNLEFDKLQ